MTKNHIKNAFKWYNFDEYYIKTIKKGKIYNVDLYKTNSKSINALTSLSYSFSVKNISKNVGDNPQLYEIKGE